MIICSCVRAEVVESPKSSPASWNAFTISAATTLYTYGARSCYSSVPSRSNNHSVPDIIAYGFGANQHSDLGPFIITIFIRGIPLTDWWKDNGAKITRPNLHINEAIVRKVYRQVAGILLQLTSFKFTMIGTLSRTSSEPLAWLIESPPWTIT